MKTGFGITVGAVCVLLGTGTLRTAFASSEMETYELHLEVPQIAQAANGDLVSVSGGGVFSVDPKTVSASGTFTHSDSEGNVVGSGTWVATQLLSFQSYGCGVVLGFPIPPNLCGGKLMLRVLLTNSASGQQFNGVLWVFCIIGPNPPNSHDDPSGEGARLEITGVNNFNKIVSGGNVYVKTN
jgi:hypothetical protein